MLDKSIGRVKDYLRKHFGKQAGLGGIALIVAAVFLPWYLSVILGVAAVILELAKPEFYLRNLWEK